MEIKKNFQNINGIPKFLDSLDIENVHVKFCKFLMGVNKRAINLAVKRGIWAFSSWNFMYATGF